MPWCGLDHSYDYGDPNATNQTYEYLDIALPVDCQTLMICAFTLNMLLSIVGNVLVLIVLIWRKSTRSDLNPFLVNLSVADLMMAVFCMPFTFPTIMLGEWVFGRVMCPVLIFMQQISVIVSICTLTAIGIDRYFAVMYPLKVRVTKNRTKIVFIFIWVIAISLATVQTVFVRVTTAISTAKLYTSAVIKMLVIIVVMFAVCWLPVHIFRVITLFYPWLYDNFEYQDTMRLVNAGILWFAMAHSFVNPFIYGFLNDSFRNEAEF
uniref:Neuropeptide Y receptor type 5-like n=1 Tax=Saccoglossus kowalevskii TaxID=10224 RepID=A0ABM0MBH8_SACKO|nr:PREDICTED: neuropeptide Y receptor type 5-like [Saccoglossus kowalevskii]